jgi:hypothetical protein
LVALQFVKFRICQDYFLAVNPFVCKALMARGISIRMILFG